MLPNDPAERHRVVAARFAELIDGVTDWSVLTPVKEWDARGIVTHLLEWLPGMMNGGSSVTLEEVDQTDLGAAWRKRSADVQAILDDADLSAEEFSNPHLPSMPLGQMLNNFYTADIFMHTWDLGRATGQDESLDRETAQEMVDGMEQMEDMLRASGQFGQRMPVADDAHPQDRLIAFIGRDPNWRP